MNGTIGSYAFGKTTRIANVTLKGGESGLTISSVAFADTTATDVTVRGNVQINKKAYATLLQGSTVNLDDTKVMHFEIDGSFDGFFDTDNPDVKGYSYEVISLEDNSAPYVANVNIYNKDKTSVVQYKLSFDEDSNMQLYYPETDQNFKLEF